MFILIVRHIENNSLGALEEVLAERRLTFEYVDAKALSDAHLTLKEIQGLIVLGGKESAADPTQHPHLLREQQLIRNAVDAGLPIFGICLGSQMLARTLGAKVERNRVNGQEAKEIGWVPLQLSPEGVADPVLSQLNGIPQFQWHEDTYHLPAGAVHLAESQTCPRQAYRLGAPGSKTYAVQFHPEMTREAIAAWLDESDSLSAERKEAVAQETEQAFAERHAASRRMFAAYCDLAFPLE